MGTIGSVKGNPESVAITIPIRGCNQVAYHVDPDGGENYCDAWCDFCGRTDTKDAPVGGCVRFGHLEKGKYYYRVFERCEAAKKNLETMCRNCHREPQAGNGLCPKCDVIRKDALEEKAKGE